ncbi:MAG: ECF transporter S component [Candidatus Thermoplasmatota archaeon]|nr:ECF transporter S component [Candidatus Thermoplasmatota archaeon]
MSYQSELCNTHRNTGTTSGKEVPHLFSTRDLVIIAVLGSLGGVLSTYIGYLGNLVNHVLGVPFGAGQFMAGLHVFWIVVGYGLIRKTGSATAIGLLKGVVEMLTGSTHGAVIVFVSLVQGLLVDGGMLFGGKRDVLPVIYLTAGFAAASNVFVFQILYLAAVPLAYIMVMSMLAFSSGIIFGGYFAMSTLDTLEAFDGSPTGAKPFEKKKRWGFNQLLSLVLIGGLAVGGIYYFVGVYELAPTEGGVEITGNVASPYIFRPSDFAGSEITVMAELSGSYTYVPPKNYTGIPLRDIIERGGLNGDSTQVHLRARDGYSVHFSIVEVMAAPDIILIQEEGVFRLVAPGYHGSYWIDQVVEARIV